MDCSVKDDADVDTGETNDVVVNAEVLPAGVSDCVVSVKNCVEF